MVPSCTCTVTSTRLSCSGGRSGESVDRPQITAVDVSEMAYIDSIGLSFLVRWAQARSSAGHPAVIRKASPRFEQVLHIAGIGSLFVRDE